MSSTRTCWKSFLTEAADLLPSIGTASARTGKRPQRWRTRTRPDAKSAYGQGQCAHGGCDAPGRAVHDMETRMEAAMQLADVPAIIIEDLAGCSMTGRWRCTTSCITRTPAKATRTAAEPGGSTEPPRLAPVIDLAAARADAKPEARVDKAARSGAGRIGGEVKCTITAAGPAQQARRSSACAPTCSTSWSTRRAKSRSRARSSKTKSPRSRDR